MEQERNRNGTGYSQWAERKTDRQTERENGAAQRLYGGMTGWWRSAGLMFHLPNAVPGLGLFTVVLNLFSGRATG